MEAGPRYADLFAAFAVEPPPGRAVLADDVPEPFRGLLVHPHHMTVTVEAFFGGPVGVRVLDRRAGQRYARMIVLEHIASRRVVQFGIVRIHLEDCTPQVRDEILAERTPLGRILIEHDVLRRIEPTGYVRVETPGKLAGWLGLGAPRPTYGRLGIIYCDGRPAIELLEILSPICSDVAAGEADQAHRRGRGGGGE
jgi:chorismate-pyruvate lyase